MLMSGVLHAAGFLPDGGERVVLLGDSNVWLGGDDCSQETGWSYWFRQRTNPLACRSFARSGATWSHCAATMADTVEVTELISDNNVVYNQILRLLGAIERNECEAPSLIIIMAGTNDAWFVKKRPGALEADAADAFNIYEEELLQIETENLRSLAQAVRYDCTLLQRAFPEARILVTTPMQSIRVGIKYIRRASDIIEGVAKLMNIDCLRLDKEAPIDCEREKVRFRYTYDGTHTNPEGARAVAELIALTVDH